MAKQAFTYAGRRQDITVRNAAANWLWTVKF